MRIRAPFIAAALAVAALAGPASRATPDCSWPTYGHDVGRSMAQDAGCSQVSPLNAATLHPKWVFNANAPVTAQPAVVGDTVYVGAFDGTFYALPADGTGTVTPKWSFSTMCSPGGDATHCDGTSVSYGRIVDSAAVADVDGTSVVVFGAGGTLYVLDAATGTELASQCFDPKPFQDPCQTSQLIEIESSPAVVANGSSAAIWVGMDYNEGGPGRAGLVRLTLAHANGAWTLAPDWKFDPEALTAYTTDVFTSGGAGDGCGNMWSSPAVDTHANLVYFDTSNCDTSRHQSTRYGGESVFAVNATTGALAWCYAPRPVNDYDLDFGATPNLLSGSRVGVGGKDGYYYTFDRVSATAPPATTDVSTACRTDSSANAPLTATHVATGDSNGGIIGTSAVGAVNGSESVFVANALPTSADAFAAPPDSFAYFFDEWSDPARLTTLHAVDVSTGPAGGSVTWNAPTVFPAYSGPVYTNGVVFAPDTFGQTFTAYAADTGTPLWSFPMFAPSGPPAVVGDSVYVGSGVSESPGTPVLSTTGFVYAFQAVTL